MAEATDKLAQTIINTISNIAKQSVNNAQYDKSFSVNIVGINQIFIDDISQEEQKEIIKKYNIPKETDEDEETYYCFKIDGVIYCKKSNANFMLYETATVRIPNGNWDRMYLEVGKGSDGGEPVTLPNIIVSKDEPTENISENDYWIKVDDDDRKNIIAMYRYLQNSKGELSWILFYNDSYTSGNGISITNNKLEVKLGAGLAFDYAGRICLDVEPVINIQYAIAAETSANP